jgi:pimeloyl-ACP methyl ester carboxylesterase
MVRGARRWWWIAGPLSFVLLVSAGVGAMAGDREPLVLDAHERSRLPGRFIALSQGYTSYDVTGPADGRVVLLVPGISIPRIVFARAATSLAAAGYRVLTYDLYGRGFSDRPHVRYDAALFNQQIDDLLGALQISGRITLVGVASGALQSMLYAEFRPARVEHLVLICPDGVNAPADGFVRLVRSPLVGETAGRAVLNMVGQRRWEERLRNYSSDRRVVEDIITSFRRQLDYKGYWRALASSIASLPIGESSDLFRRIDQQGTPTLVLWGTDDVIIPVHLGHEVRRLMPSATYVEIPAGHLPQYERPDLTNEAILRFLNATHARRARASSNRLAAGWSNSSE